MRASRVGRRFTLIELMIVVVIISIIAAVAIPGLLAAKKKADEAAAAQREAASPTQTPAQAEGPAPAPEEGARPAEPPAAVPTIEEADLQVQLEASHHLQGLLVHTRYDASIEGRFRFRNRSEQVGRVRLEFPFPAETREARNVSLALGAPGAELQEPDGVTYARDRILWVGPLAPGAELAARVSYSAQGRDRFVYDLRSAGRIGALRVEVLVSGVAGAVVPDSALQPVTLEPSHAVWEARNLVTDRGIVVDLPATTSPLGRVMLLCQLAGLAVLLFGAGFWYLNELRQPGLLDDFRWGHFLLLAITYSLFFGIFAVLAFHDLALPLALGLSALLSLPLLAVHVGRFVSLGFAVAQVLPLAAFTLGLVVNGVYGGAARDYVFIGAAVATIAFVTLTYRGWAAGRKDHRDRRARERARAERQQAGEHELGLLREQGEAAGPLDEAARRLLGIDDPTERAPLRDALQQQRDRLAELIDRLDGFSGELDHLAKIESDEEHERAAHTLLKDIGRVRERLVETAGALRDAGQSLDRARQRERVRQEQEEKPAHCLACGHAAADSPCCPQCGVPRPRELTCGRCGEPLLLPLHLLRRRVAGGQEPLHCLVCGEPHRGDPGAQPVQGG